ncbi:hypothetical protein AOLI_G00034460 [Acnodon oligacanthus]
MKAHLPEGPLPQESTKAQTQRPQARSLFLSAAETSGRQHPAIFGEVERAPNHIGNGFDIQSMA